MRPVLESHPILYSFRRCPYAMRARMALIVSGQSCRLREVDLKAKPAEMLDASPKGTVPVIVLPDGRVLEESLDIMAWALERHDPSGWLEEDRAAQDALVARIDQNFKPHLDRYKYPSRYDGVDPLVHRTAGLEILMELSNLLEATDFLTGPVPRYADIAIFPFIRQFANTDRVWFDALDIKPVQDWLARCLNLPVFETAMQKFAPWQSGEAEPHFP